MYATPTHLPPRNMDQFAADLLELESIQTHKAQHVQHLTKSHADKVRQLDLVLHNHRKAKREASAVKVQTEVAERDLESLKTMIPKAKGQIQRSREVRTRAKKGESK